MAESSATSTDTAGGQPRPLHRLFESTAYNVIGWIFTSLLAGSSAALVVTQADIQKIGEELRTIVTDAEKRISGQLERLEWKQGEITSSIRNTRDEVTEVAREVNSESARIVADLAAASDGRERLLNRVNANRQQAQDNFLALSDKSIGLSKQIDSTKRAVIDGHKGTGEQIQSLSDQFNSYQQSFIDEMTKLADEGREIVNNDTILDDGRIAATRDWIAKANYMIRSLAIPTEDGWLKDTSAVKKDIQKAMEGFDRSDDETRMLHAQRVLVIVEAIRDLAKGGRIP